MKPSARQKYKSRFLAGVLALVFLTWAGTYFWLLLAKQYQAYLLPSLWPLVLLGGVIYLAFFGMMARYAFLTDTGWQGQLGPVLVLLLPLFFLKLSLGASLGGFAFGAQGFGPLSQPLNPQLFSENVLLPQATVTPVLAPAGYGEARPSQPAKTSVLPKVGSEFPLNQKKFTLAELRFWATRLSGKRVITEGKVMQNESVPPGYLAVVRFVMTCCLADARAVAALVKTDLKTYPAANQWIRVEGTLTLPKLKGQRMVCIVAEKIQVLPTPPPWEQYLY